MKRTKPPKRTAALKRSGSLDRRPLKPHRPRVEPGRAEAIKAWRIAVLGDEHSPLDPHHVVKAQHLAREATALGLKGPAYWAAIYDPGLGIPLTREDHTAHHARTRLIYLEDLPERVVEHVRVTWGEPGLVELERLHPRRYSCATCQDTGEVHDNPSRINDPACERSWPCPDCEEDA